MTAFHCHTFINAAARYKQVFVVKKSKSQLLWACRLHFYTVWAPVGTETLQCQPQAPSPTLLTWLHFMPSTRLAATARGASLACVKWLFTRTVHFILHRLEALRGAEMTHGYMFTGNPNHLSIGHCLSGWKKAKRGSNWATQYSSRTLLGSCSI